MDCAISRPGLSMRRVLIACALLAQMTAADATELLRLATTTSTENSGLLKELLPLFEVAHQATVQVIAVGTGKALKLGESGDVDVLLTHSRVDEEKFMADGHGVDRRDVMYNDFLLVGPSADAAQIAGGHDAVVAFRAIAEKQAPFISRGDNSGTHSMEKMLWRLADLRPEGEWYRSAGLGMGEVLMMASELNAYSLTDRATYLGFHRKTGLSVIVAGDARLFNRYSVILVNPSKNAAINAQLARQFSDWLTGPVGQSAIAAFRIEGQQVFFPSAKRR
jgi:tungstate transport system substrate-binding protein